MIKKNLKIKFQKSNPSFIFVHFDKSISIVFFQDIKGIFAHNKSIFKKNMEIIRFTNFDLFEVFYPNISIYLIKMKNNVIICSQESKIFFVSIYLGGLIKRSFKSKIFEV